jgi:hypothetical protein
MTNLPAKLKAFEADDIYEFRYGLGTDTCHIHKIGWKLALCGCPVTTIPKPDDLVNPCWACLHDYQEEIRR